MMTSKKSTKYTIKPDQETHKPGGKIIRGCGRGGISRFNSSSVQNILPSRIREAFLRSPTLQLTKLTVSNLDHGITDLDMYELFSRFGPLKFAKIQCDKMGRSLGFANVLFERRSDAIEAIKYCSGIPFEGRNMSIQFSNRLKKPSFTVNGNIRSTGSPKKNKRKCRHRQKRALQTNDDELVAQLEESMKSQLIISNKV